MKNNRIIIVGGGGAGLVAAISAARKGAEVVIAERMPILGKKVLASGAGRCNLLNETLNASFYNPESKGIVAGVFKRFGKEDILAFFREIGLWTYAEEDGRIFPLTDKALTLMELLQAELAKLKVKTVLNFSVDKIQPQKGGGFIVTSTDGVKLEGDKVVIAAGGQSYPQLGSDGSGFKLAKNFGHKIIEPVPATVPLISQDTWCRTLEGQKIRGRACPILDNKKVMDWIEGDILFAKYGLSGTAILDISDPISVALNRKQAKRAAVALDFVPFLKEEELHKEFQRRLARGMTGNSIVAGLLPPKFANVLQDFLVPEKIKQLASILKERIFYISETKSWDAAEFTAGGVAADEIDPETFESKKQKGLYLCGEVVDVNGRRGGYQLAWAWATGFLTGISASS